MVSVRKRRGRGPSLRPPINKLPTLTHHDCRTDNNNIIQVKPEERENHVLGQENPNLITGETVASSYAMDSALVTIPESRISMSSILENASLQDLELDIEQLELQRAGIDIRSSADARQEVDTRVRVDIWSSSGDMEPVPETNISEFPVQLNRHWSKDEDDDVGDQKVEVSKIVSHCLVIDREMSYIERMKYIFGSSIVSNSGFPVKVKGRSRRTLQGPRQFIQGVGGGKF